MQSLNSSFAFLTNATVQLRLLCAPPALTEMCEVKASAFKAVNTNTKPNSPPNFRHILPVRLHECNKVELDLLKKQFHITAHFLFKFNNLQRFLIWTTKPGVHRHRGYLQEFFSTGDMLQCSFDCIAKNICMYCFLHIVRISNKKPPKNVR